MGEDNGEDIVAKSHLHQPGMRPTHMPPLSESESDEAGK